MQNPTELEQIIRRTVSLNFADMDRVIPVVYEPNTQLFHFGFRARNRREILLLYKAWAFFFSRLFYQINSIGKLVEFLIIDYNEDANRATVRLFQYATPKTIKLSTIFMPFASIISLIFHLHGHSIPPLIRFDICSIYYFNKYKDKSGRVVYKILAQEDYFLIDPSVQIIVALFYVYFIRPWFGFIVRFVFGQDETKFTDYVVYTLKRLITLLFSWIGIVVSFFPAAIVNRTDPCQ